MQHVDPLRTVANAAQAAPRRRIRPRLSHPTAEAQMLRIGSCHFGCPPGATPVPGSTIPLTPMRMATRSAAFDLYGRDQVNVNDLNALFEPGTAIMRPRRENDRASPVFRENSGWGTSTFCPSVNSSVKGRNGRALCTCRSSSTVMATPCTTAFRAGFPRRWGRPACSCRRCLPGGLRRYYEGCGA